MIYKNSFCELPCGAPHLRDVYVNCVYLFIFVLFILLLYFFCDELVLLGR